MILTAISLLFCGMLVVYADPKRVSFLHEYEGWLVYLHVLKYGVLFVLFALLASEIAFPFLLKALELADSSLPLDLLPIPMMDFLDKNHSLLMVSSRLIEETSLFNGFSNHENGRFYIEFSIFSIVLAIIYYCYKVYFKKSHDDGRVAMKICEDQFSRHSNLNLFILYAFYNSDYLLITLDNNKVYCGIVTDIPAPVTEKGVHEFDIKIIISESGYRDCKSQKYIRTNDYEAIYSDDREDDFPEITIARQSVVSISLYKPTLYYLAFDHNERETIITPAYR